MRRTGVLALAALLVTGGANAARAPVPVQVWIAGDEALALEFKGRVLTALKKFAALSLADDTTERPGTMVVECPQALQVQDVGGRSRVTFRTEITVSGEGRRDAFGGFCWADELNDCAAQIASRVNLAAER